jgi:adenine-specific DNA-methyltransferase
MPKRTTPSPSKPAASKRGAARAPAKAAQTASYEHPTAKALLRPEAGAQSRFKKAKPKQTYRYDSSLAPELRWDGQNPAREQGEAAIARIEAKLAALAAAQQELFGGDRPDALEPVRRKELSEAIQHSLRDARDAVGELKSLSRPFLDWAGKAERLSFDVPSLPLFIHERLSTEAILATLKSHRSSGQGDFLRDYFGNPNRPLHQQLAESYEHENGWQNRLILGDSLVVMNSLLTYDKLAGRVQMIYMDPPYGVRFGSNFQPFVRKRDVAHNDDEAMTREPEMVKAYRDTWELGLHSYLTYLRDRLKLARDLLTENGSIFVQISDENLHHVREVLDEVFGADCFMSLISFRTKIPLGTTYLAGVSDYILWYAKDRERCRFNRLYSDRETGGDTQFTWIELPDGTRRRMNSDERTGSAPLPSGARPFRLTDLVSSGRTKSCVYDFDFAGRRFSPSGGKSWKTNKAGMTQLIERRRIMATGRMPSYVFFQDDYPVQELSNLWADTQGAADKQYVVQTAEKVIQRCLLMTTDPGDLVLDPTCGSGTTAYVAELWGRRWITTDTSRVPLALARQRLLTAVLPYYELKQPSRGPAGGFVYQRKQNRNGDEVGGLVPHITLGSIANNEPPKMEVLVDRPDKKSGVTRLTGRFVVEATLPLAYGADGEAQDLGADLDWIERMIAILRASPVLYLGKDAAGRSRNIKLARVRRPSQALVLSAEAFEVAPDVALPETDAAENAGSRVEEPKVLGRPVALLFGPENGGVSERVVREAHDEASMKSRGYAHLYVVGFGIEPRAREYLEHADSLGVPATYVQATPDVLMGDLLKNLRSSQIFSVCGQPDVAVEPVPRPSDAPDSGDSWYQVTLRGLNVYDPITQTVDERKGDDVPAWLLDTNYNGMVFHVCQAFFPRTSAWDNLKRALKADFDDSVWAHLSGTTSEPFTAGDQRQIAVKVIDDRGNELLVVTKMER